jgi:hypothetical protein
MVVGSIWPEGAWGGRSTARWQASAAGDRRRGCRGNKWKERVWHDREGVVNLASLPN